MLNSERIAAACLMITDIYHSPKTQMFRLTRAPNLMLAQHWVNLLRQAGIPCHLTNRFTQGGAGEIPVDQCGPDIWLEDEQNKVMAMEIIDGTVNANLPKPLDWHCAHCTEWLEGQFTTCWKCGTVRPSWPSSETAR